MKTGVFVILEHDWPQRHWDFLVDLATSDERVAAWALDQLPGEQEIAGSAVKLADHRRIYLGYEGRVGNGRGAVVRMISGEYQLQHDFNVQGRNELQLRIQSSEESRFAISGVLTLRKQGQPSQDQEHWSHRTDAENDWVFVWQPGRVVG